MNVSFIYIFLSIFFPHQILEWWHNICSKSRGRLVKTLIRISENTTHGPTLLFSLMSTTQSTTNVLEIRKKFAQLFVYIFRERTNFLGGKKNGNDMTFDMCFSRKFKSYMPNEVELVPTPNYY